MVGRNLIPNGSFLAYKMRRTRKKKGGWRAERTKCCRTDSGHFSLCLSFLCSIVLSCAGFHGGSRCFEERRVLPAAPPTCSLFCFVRTGIGICSSACSAVTDPRPIVGCSFLLVVLLIHTFIRLRLPVSVSIRVSVSMGCVPMYLQSCVAGSLSLSILACSLVQDPGGPTSFQHTVAYYLDSVVVGRPWS